jgi:hypothetical protein
MSVQRASTLSAAQTLNGYVPAATVSETDTVRVLLTVSLAGGVTGLGENEHDAPEGRPGQLSATALPKPLSEDTVQVPVALPLGVAESVLGAQLTLMSLTASVRSEVRVSVPLTPWSWNASLSTGTVPLVLTVRVLFAVPLAGGVTADELRLHDAPGGSPSQLSATVLLKPLSDVTVHVLVLIPPGTIATVLGEQFTV